MNQSKILNASSVQYANYLRELSFLEGLADARSKEITAVEKIYPMRITKHLLEEIAAKQSRALFNQFFPTIHELDDEDGAGAFFADEKPMTASESIIQKYPNRCIVYLTSDCYANCRHCSRKAQWQARVTFSKMQFDEDYRYLMNTPTMEEVILTGGDPLTMRIEDLRYVLDKISRLENVKTIRLATRAFTVHPAAITDELCELLKSCRSLVVMTQFNHADEFSEETEIAIDQVQKTGCPILNQAVLLKGINDDSETLHALLAKCATNKVIPYYLFHAFKVKGAQCFRPDVIAGMELVNGLVGKIGGWWIPKYTLIPDLTGVKVPAQPNYVTVSADGKIKVEDFKGRKLDYL